MPNRFFHILQITCCCESVPSSPVLDSWCHTFTNLCIALDEKRKPHGLTVLWWFREPALWFCAPCPLCYPETESQGMNWGWGPAFQTFALGLRMKEEWQAGLLQNVGVQWLVIWQSMISYASFTIWRAAARCNKPQPVVSDLSVTTMPKCSSLLRDK